MQKQRYIVFVILIFTLFLVGIFFVRHSEIQARKNAQSVEKPASSTTSMPTNKSLVYSSVKVANLQTNIVSVPSSTPAERAAWRREMFQKDQYFEYKAPISFYGRVVDESNNSIDGVAIALSCVDASEATGETTHNIISDNNGLFSLEGSHGKSLLVASLVKKGYTESVVQNKFSFNYGYFSDPYYFSPDPNNPVIFVMRKNREGESLIVRSQAEAKLEANGQSKLFPIGNGDEHILIERLPNETVNPRFWDAQITVPDGGLQLTTEEFPYQAPEDGYTNNFIMTSSVFIPGAGMPSGMFYIKTPNGYARVKIYYIPNKPWIYVDSWFNPNPTSRNLEVDPNKVVEIK